jgi:hypothetical protein
MNISPMKLSHVNISRMKGKLPLLACMAVLYFPAVEAKNRKNVLGIIKVHAIQQSV